MAKKPRILFVCTDGSSRCLMAEGLARYLAGARIETESAGTVEAELDPYTQWAMNEAGTDIAQLVIDPLECKDLASFTHIVTLSAASQAAMRSIPAEVEVAHWEIPNPSLVRGRPLEIIGAYKSIRNEIERKVKGLIGQALAA